MRTRLLSTFVLLAALTLAGCSATSVLSDRTPPTGQLSSPPSAAAQAANPTPTAAATPTSPPSKTPSATATASPTPHPLRASTSSKESATSAVQAVIQRANEEQQQAFAQNDPSIMQDTATSDYYQQMVQINSDMASGGVSAIKLVKIEWGPVNLSNATTAEATTFETWQTTYADGSTDQSRERNVYTLVLEQGSWKIQNDDHPDSNPSQPAVPGAPTPPGSVSPNPPAGTVPPTLPPGQTDTSHNWSGYSATGGTYTAVTGTWTVPESTSTGGFASGATWVGIGGVLSRDLIQAGTNETSNGAGTVHYQAWIEMLPQAMRPVPLAVRPGDSLTVVINKQEGNQWLIAFKNNTTGQTYQTTVQYRSSLSSAEWIVEAPSVGRRTVPLDNFGVVQFSGGSTVKDGKSVTIAQAGAQPISMFDYQGSIIATPSALAADGKGFSVSRSTPSPVIQPRRGRRGAM